MSYKFPLGQVLMSPGVRAMLTSGQLISVLRFEWENGPQIFVSAARHANGITSGQQQEAQS